MSPLSAARWIAVPILAVGALGFYSAAYAAQPACVALEGSSESLANAEPQARLRFIRGALAEDARRSRTWRWT